MSRTFSTNCGGLLASKPYAASGAYINRMSNYCTSCAYDVKQRTGPQACPFNALYWDFIAPHAAINKGNPRMAQIVRTYDKFDNAEKARIRDRAASVLKGLDCCSAFHTYDYAAEAVFATHALCWYEHTRDQPRRRRAHFPDSDPHHRFCHWLARCTRNAPQEIAMTIAVEKAASCYLRAGFTVF